MVGSVLIQRMLENNDFKRIAAPVFFTTSNIRGTGPDIGLGHHPLQDAYDIAQLMMMTIIVSCQGGDYTKRIFSDLRSAGWDGYWIDAASTLRMDDSSIIVLDPLNLEVIKSSLSAGVKNYIGGNCTVSLMLMAFGSLIGRGCVEWISTMTYQAASGAGAESMKELLIQMGEINNSVGSMLKKKDSSILPIDANVTDLLKKSALTTSALNYPLAGNMLPWIDSAMENGQTREEWKGESEANKILSGVSKSHIPIDGLCVRVGTLRCHGQALTIKLNKNIPISDAEEIIQDGNDWVKVVPNDRDSTLANLTPASVAGTLAIPVGRLRKMSLGEQYMSAFTVGDQLLWGAAEPLRRVLNIIIDYLDD